MVCKTPYRIKTGPKNMTKNPSITILKSLFDISGGSCTAPGTSGIMREYICIFFKELYPLKKLNLDQILFVSSVQDANESVRDIWDKPWDQEDVYIYHI